MVGCWTVNGFGSEDAEMVLISFWACSSCCTRSRASLRLTMVVEKGCRWSGVGGNVFRPPMLAMKERSIHCRQLWHVDSLDMVVGTAIVL